MNKKTQTVKDHLEEASDLIKHVQSANALVEKLRAELSLSREALSVLSDAAHPKVPVVMPYGMRGSAGDGITSPQSLADKMTCRINALLGDRA